LFGGPISVIPVIPQRTPMRKKRKPRAAATQVDSEVDILQQATVSVTISRGRSAPKLPHERDESVATPTRPARRIVQAERDLAQGRQDTDCYNDARRAFERARKR